MYINIHVKVPPQYVSQFHSYSTFLQRQIVKMGSAITNSAACSACQNTRLQVSSHEMDKDFGVFGDKSINIIGTFSGVKKETCSGSHI